MPHNSSRLPALVIQFAPDDQPAYLGTWLDRVGQPWQLAKTDEGVDLPTSIAGFGGLALLGGVMGANDDLPALRQAEALIRDAFTRGIPVIGHCLGGQLMARALGSPVTRGAQPEIGWTQITINDHPLARYWFGEHTGPCVMQWHYDTFATPEAATRLAVSPGCANQAFALGELHLGMQFHIEVDTPKIGGWLHTSAHEVEEAAGEPWVQSPGLIEISTRQQIAASQRLADHIYHRWLSRFAKPGA
ncbi:GMP synthase-like glutamine amidotransferase [Silvimonas terrae]|uniref:GMP synthase-like glutamine amidotransferase n=1 Tax=Silvimonas terrae TaxID=300266 RepID=A0A840R8M9_9NEIS|nr:type 1 glutamine amidotransferase [Silvimonas terrae]MBB5189709.1 GMP synthase-like glutamine amidotransferase [Silvimonas terrae]